MVKETSKYKEILTHCARTNGKRFNQEKAEEEAIEFLQAIVKRRTKDKSNPSRPTKEDILEEYSHTIFRAEVYLLQLFPDLNIKELRKKIKEEKHRKIDSVIKWKEEGKYILQL